MVGVCDGTRTRMGRECEARGCTNLIAPTARVDARYCSAACRKRASRSLKCDKIDVQPPDTVPPENVTASVPETQQNWGSKSAPQISEGFSDTIPSRWRPGSPRRAQPLPPCERLSRSRIPGSFRSSCSARSNAGDSKLYRYCDRHIDDASHS